VIDEADLTLKEAKFKVGEGEGPKVGPGFISTSPAKSRRQKIRRLEVRRGMRRS
jgi:hypothetical protein